MKSKILSFLLLALLLLSCGRNGSLHGFDEKVYSPEYAGGLEILGDSSCLSTMIVTRSPWQGADSTASTRLLIVRGEEDVPEGYRGQILRGDARRVVCMSSSHVAMLAALGAVDRVVGVSGMQFINNPDILAGRDTIADVGYDGNIDYEALIAVRPDVVLLYGVAGASTMEPKLRELGIPYAYFGEYLEESPLGKAEWLVAMADLIGERQRGIEIFREIPKRYNEIKEAATHAGSTPSVMINTPYRDQWIMAPGSSYVARLIADAGGEYVFGDTSGNSSFPIDIEQAYLLASGADCWINTGQIDTLDGLLAAVPKFADTKPVKSGNVWNTTLRATACGGNDYWESGVVNPHLVLRDLVKIFHPELYPDSSFVYYKRL